MASLDTRRPAAMEQLAVLGQQVGVETLPIVAGQSAVQIARRAIEAARLGGYDVVMLDTAGRTTVDEALMAEVAEVKAIAQPHEVLLVADALTGQDAVNTARAFDGRVGITGIVLTRVDGDGRGGAALSMRAVTGKPIKLVGTGEKMDALDEFHPARIANRILGMGDIVSLVEKAAQSIDQEKALRIAEKMRKGKFDLEDMREQLGQVEKLGGLGGLMGMMPGIAKMKNQMAAANMDGKVHRPADRHHQLDDAEGAPQPRRAEGLAQEAHRGGLGREGRGGQPPPQDAPPDGRHDEDDGPGRKARPHGRPRQHVRHGRGNGGRRHALAGNAGPAQGQAASGHAAGHARVAPAEPACPPEPEYPRLRRRVS